MTDLKIKSNKLSMMHYQLFDTLAQLNNFRLTAKHCNTTLSKVSNAIKELERHYNATLFYRNTRNVSITPEGQKIWHTIKELLALENNLYTQIHSVENNLYGLLKIGVPQSVFSEICIPSLKFLSLEHPQLQLDWHIGNYLPNIIADNFDGIIFCGLLPPHLDYYAAKIGTWTKITCATQTYLDDHADIKSPSDLAQHKCIDHSHNFKGTWEFKVHDEVTHIAVAGQYKSSSSKSLLDMALSDLGIAYLPSFTVQSAIKHKKLMSILQDYQPPALDCYLITKKSLKDDPKLQALFNTIKDHWL
ncbi:MULTISPECIES: LysR family transcriptional regulator [Cysteiniphilum]|uniref:LysR family transcriptional regulator n=1 Tax=Cysteiniphilum TaxID=2056696 RepID=UPI00177DE967|nr:MULTISPECIES: LysR family transcriptional regulator [Cysteiniphilum]